MDVGGPSTARPVAGEGACAGPHGTIDLSTGWRLDVPGQASRALPSLTSWHELADLRFHSGVVTYLRDVDVPAALGTSGCSLWLDFGEGTPRAEEKLTNGMRAWLDAPIRDGAVVLVNGVEVGSVWAPPYRVDVSKALRTGRNALEVRVGNTALNRWASRPHPDYKLLHLRHGKRFDPQDIDKIVPQPSGIIGRPRLVY